MQLAGPVVVEYLREDARMAVEEILVEDRIVVGQRLGESGQARGRDLLQRRPIGLVSDAADVEDHTVFRVGHRRSGDGNDDDDDENSDDTTTPMMKAFATDDNDGCSRCS